MALFCTTPDCPIIASVCTTVYGTRSFGSEARPLGVRCEQPRFTGENLDTGRYHQYIAFAKNVHEVTWLVPILTTMKKL